jgi:hypothetical protein
MALWKRKLALIATVASGALAVSVLANVLDLSDGASLAIAAVGLALAITFGGPWAFDRELPVKDPVEVRSHKTAVLADQQNYDRTSVGGRMFIQLQRWQEVGPVGDQPAGRPTDRARAVRAAFSDLPLKLVDPVAVAHINETILRSNGSAE